MGIIIKKIELIAKKQNRKKLGNNFRQIKRVQ